jgi:O-antigen/teichoic acid export membrane protein
MMPTVPAAPGQPEPPPPKLKIFSKIAYLLGARWFHEALQLVFFIYLARVSTATYGEFMMALGLGSILFMVADFGLNLPFVSLVAGSREKMPELFCQALMLKLLFFVLALLGAQIFISWQDYSPGLGRLLLLIGAGVALEALASTFFVVLQVEGRQDQEAKVRAAGAALGFGFGLLTLVLGAAPLVTAFFKLIDSVIKLAGGAWLLLWRRHWGWLWPTWRQLQALAQLGLIFALMEITASIYNKANLFFLQKHGGAEAVAQYSAAWQVVEGFSGIVANLVLQNVLYPVFSQLWREDRPAVTRLAHTTARWLLALALPSMFLLFVESDRIIPLIYGPQYTQAIWLQQYLVATIIIGFWHNLAGFLLLSMRKERRLLSFYVVGLIFNLTWCLTILPLDPLPGAAFAIILSKGLVAILTISYCHYFISFITLQDLKHTGAALFLSAGLYFGSQPFLPREAGEFLTLIPCAVLGWYWMRHQAPIKLSS